MATNQQHVSHRGGIDIGIVMAVLILFAGLGVYLIVDSLLKTYGELARLLGDLTMAGLAFLAMVMQELNDRTRLRASIRHYRGQ